MLRVAAVGLACSLAPSLLSAQVAPAPGPTLTPQQSGTRQRLQAISPVNDQVVWASGAGGTYTVTTDGGQTWRAGVVPGADSLEFRDVEAVSATQAWLLAAGAGDRSRIYHTEDGGRSWDLQFVNQDTLAFYDCFAFWSPTHGLTFSDQVDGRFPAIQTSDGRHWTSAASRLPPALPGEGGFAASGTCVATLGDRFGWIGTGAGPQARVLRTTDGGRTWTAHATPTVQGTPTSGVFSVAFRDPGHGILGAGELAPGDSNAATIAVSGDGGVTWTLATPVPFAGAVFGLAYVGDGPAVVATGPGGAAWSRDEGKTWQLLPDARDYWAVAFGSERSGWLVGMRGSILKVSF